MLYFVAKGDGSHYFSATLDAEHNLAVQQYIFEKVKWPLNQENLLRLEGRRRCRQNDQRPVAISETYLVAAAGAYSGRRQTREPGGTALAEKIRTLVCCWLKAMKR